jgi:outer membrane protein OmpA-like peptidoglycan-associated protein
MIPARRTFSLLGALTMGAAALLATGCPPKKPKEEPIKEVLPTPEATLQVAGIEPAFGPADRAFSAEILGSGFVRGSRVSINGSAVEGAQFMDAHVLDVNVPALPAGTYDVTVSNPDGTKSTLKKGLTLTERKDTGGGCGPLTVHFDFDSSTLFVGDRKALDALAACVRAGTGDVRIEGHCDEKGTTEYNLSLGQRRADAVEAYLAGQGLSPGHLHTISYGEERPVDRSGTPEGDAANRRAEITVRE